MSFPAFQFRELVKETWEESALFELLDSMKFCFAVFQCDEHNCLQISSSEDSSWNMPQQDIAQAKVGAWEVTKSIVQEGAIVRELKEPQRDNSEDEFPYSEANHCCACAPTQGMRDTPLPQSDALTGLSSYTKHSF